LGTDGGQALRYFPDIREQLCYFGLKLGNSPSNIFCPTLDFGFLDASFEYLGEVLEALRARQA
jgi:hypothetical protein